MSKIIYFLIILFVFNSCSIVKKIAGADINSVQFEKAREAKMLEVRARSAGLLAGRLNDGRAIDDADIIIYLNEEFIYRIIKQYEGSKGWLDAVTNYTVKKIAFKLNNGSAIVSVELDAFNNSHNVNVALTMDCILVLQLRGKELFVQIEPFNISPKVDAGGLLSAAKEIIENLIKINLAEVSKNFPEIKLPVAFNNKFEIKENKSDIKDRINLNIYVPSRNIKYELVMKEILLFEGKVLVAINIAKVEVN